MSSLPFLVFYLCDLLPFLFVGFWGLASCHPQFTLLSTFQALLLAFFIISVGLHFLSSSLHVRDGLFPGRRFLELPCLPTFFNV